MKLVNGIAVDDDEADLAQREIDQARHEERMAERAATATRTATRSALRAQWDALPDWINGPYRTVFDATNNLLDESKDAAAAELIDSCEPTSKIANDPATYPELGGATRLQYFTVVKAQFKAAIENL